MFAVYSKVLRVAMETVWNSLFLIEENASMFEDSEHSYLLYVRSSLSCVIKPLFCYVLLAAFHTLITD